VTISDHPFDRRSNAASALVGGPDGAMLIILNFSSSNVDFIKLVVYTS
jgi:hypothetical protein